MWIFDATPLIYLAKARRLKLVTTLDGRCVLPERVHAEVVASGLDGGYPDARRIERRIDEGVLEVASVEETDVSERLDRNPDLSDADVSVLAHAAAVDGIAVMDDAYGRNAADVEGIETRGTAYVVLLAAKKGEIDADEARETIDAMVDRGWYCAPDVYARIVRTIESLADRSNAGGKR
ncbi:DUF3368 domain-containing protein [Natrarchaeobius oligotrophus]|uniref:DUF3368 domain-containing protein n=1 Tax=Natrarchaeobius chitinivorans TaxID=1679083 RepID=A0A3N6PKG6_NATCH|nr:DUF3368 domain-containing protein [Natrarchaeobius chitinivorans]RQG99235.1 DUF3368 domain-containing protein [Natrarchaeobius chitinivorans]